MKLTARYLYSSAIAHLLILMGFVERAKKKIFSGDYILSIYCHNPSAKEFESCIKWLLDNKFHFLDAATLEQIVSGSLPFPRGGVIVTVDDGWKNNESAVVEVAEKYNIPVTIFISTEPVENGVFWWTYVKEARKRNLTRMSVEVLKKIPNEERTALVEDLKKQINGAREAMTIEQVIKISKSKHITIGGHTHSHPILPNCRKEQVLEELKLSKEKLESWTGREIRFFAYPNGDHTADHVKVLKDLNYKLAFTTKPEYLTPQSFQHSNYELPRFTLWENASLAENICRITGVWEPLMARLGRLKAVRKKNKMLKPSVFQLS